MYVYRYMYSTCTCTYSTDQMQGIRLVNLHTFAQGGKLDCTLRQIHVYTLLNGFMQGDKRVYLLVNAFALYLASDLYCIYVYIQCMYIHIIIYPVEPPYKGHPLGPRKVSLLERCPLFRGKNV